MPVGDSIPIKDRIGNYNGDPSIGDKIIVKDGIGFTSTSPSIGDKISVQQGTSGKVGYKGGVSAGWSTEEYHGSAISANVWIGIIRRQRSGEAFKYFIQTRDLDTLEKLSEVQFIPPDPAIFLESGWIYPISGDENELYLIDWDHSGYANITVVSIKTGAILRTGTIYGTNSAGNGTCIAGANGYIIGNADWYYSNNWYIYNANSFALTKTCTWGIRYYGAYSCGGDDVLIHDYNTNGSQYRALISDCSKGSAWITLGFAANNLLIAAKTIDDFVLYTGGGRGTTPLYKSCTFKKYISGVLQWTKTVNVITDP